MATQPPVPAKKWTKPDRMHVLPDIVPYIMRSPILLWLASFRIVLCSFLFYCRQPRTYPFRYRVCDRIEYSFSTKRADFHGIHHNQYRAASACLPMITQCTSCIVLSDLSRCVAKALTSILLRRWGVWLLNAWIGENSPDLFHTIFYVIEMLINDFSQCMWKPRRMKSRGIVQHGD
jgi:hypothetical protein